MTAPDPILAAIDAAAAAGRAHLVALDGLDENDDAQMGRANAAAQASIDTFVALTGVMPTTMAGLRALADFYAEDVERSEGWTGDEAPLRHLARAMAACEASDGFLDPVEPIIEKEACALDRERERRAGWPAITVPGRADVEAAWHGLPAEARDRIGITAVDYVFQGFVFGDGYAVNGQHEDMPVVDEAIREAACDAENRLLNELPRVVWDALPALFGEPDENPAWCQTPGPRPVEEAA